MCVSDVAERFQFISGIDKSVVSDWLFLCVEACEHIQKICYVPITRELSKRLTTTAAIYAYYRYSLYAQDVDSFKAGNVEVTHRGNLQQKANQMWQNELIELKSVIREDSRDFCFLKA